ncbi:MAG: hypothetical protein LBQ58_06090 [Synergistaceae bacterium]|jgi:hypothetical protein|nr:hypothetical protein [Synergistaceae bacterium]
MKAPIPKHEKKGPHSMICMIILLGVLFSSMSLGSMRLYGLYLEHRLATVTKRIETVNSRFASLEEYHASLLSPSRIYNYAKMELKMVTASDIQTIRLNSSGQNIDTGMTLADSTPAMPGASGKFGGILDFFTGIANAKD